MQLNAILFPTDFSATSTAALDYASSLASVTNATLHIVHVADNSPAYLVGYGIREYDADFLRELKVKLQDRLGRIDSLQPGVDVERYYLTGSAVAEIVALADRKNIDLIVMGTTGRTGWSRALLGSVAEGVLRRANCPVLTIKVPNAAEGISEEAAFMDSCGEDVGATRGLQA